MMIFHMTNIPIIITYSYYHCYCYAAFTELGLDAAQAGGPRTPRREEGIITQHESI